MQDYCTYTYVYDGPYFIRSLCIKYILYTLKSLSRVYTEYRSYGKKTENKLEIEYIRDAVSFRILLHNVIPVYD